MKDLIKQYLWILFLAAVLLLCGVAVAEDSFENTMKKIDILEGKNVSVEYEKILPLKDQYCFIKVNMKEINGEIVKEEVVECADGRKTYDGPSYWELFAQFYYRDINTPEYCRYYTRPKHAFRSFGKVCMNKDGEWEVQLSLIHI